MKTGAPLADVMAGMYGATGVLAALHERDSTGLGRVVRTSLLAAVVGAHAYHGTQWTVGHRVPTAVGNQHPAIAPYGLFRAADGPVQICCGSQGLWRAFAPLVGIAYDDPRVTRVVELQGLINAALSSEPADVWVERCVAAGVPAGKVRTLDQVYGWDQTRSQGLVVTVEPSGVGPVEVPGPPWRFDDQPYAGARETNAAPPQLGEHNDAVRSWLDEREAASAADSAE